MEKQWKPGQLITLHIPAKENSILRYFNACIPAHNIICRIKKIPFQDCHERLFGRAMLETELKSFPWLAQKLPWGYYLKEIEYSRKRCHRRYPM